MMGFANEKYFLKPDFLHDHKNSIDEFGIFHIYLKMNCKRITNHKFLLLKFYYYQKLLVTY